MKTDGDEILGYWMEIGSTWGGWDAEGRVRAHVGPDRALRGNPLDFPKGPPGPIGT